MFILFDRFSSKILEAFSNSSYSVNKFDIEVLRGEEWIFKYQNIGPKVDKQIADSLHKLIKYEDRIYFQSFELNLAGYKFNYRGGVSLLIRK